jgi:uncharacterized protein YjbJ (UPF0337 family)
MPENRSVRGDGAHLLLEISPRQRSAIMNEDVLKGKWHQLKGEVKSRWGKLTDDDLDRVEGEAEKLVGRVQERYGYQRDEAKREVDEFIRRYPEVS